MRNQIDNTWDVNYVFQRETFRGKIYLPHRRDLISIFFFLPYHIMLFTDPGTLILRWANTDMRFKEENVKVDLAQPIER